MGPRRNLNPTLRALAEPIERVAQINIALVLTQAVIVRLSLRMAAPDQTDPDPLLLIAFLAACTVAGVLVVLLSRSLRRFRTRALRIGIAVGSFVLQAAAFQLLYAYAS